MEQVKWFERRFDFAIAQNIMPSILERLSGTSVRLIDKIRIIPRESLKVRLDDKWSIQENIGHLIDLEPLWQGRLQDILNGQIQMRDADLQNRKTHEANHHRKSLDVLLDEFHFLRRATVDRLEMLTEEEVMLHSLHPRLKTPMRIMDLFLFVAEHDDHHLARISRIHREVLNQNINAVRLTN